jgi:hypothetical protein
MAKWTREQIIRAILSREAAGLPLALGRTQGVDQALYQAGSRIFGSWPNALLAAGIAPERAQARERWPPGKILSVIRSLSRRRRPLRAGELKERHSYLIQAARRCFGSWSKALIAAGVDPVRLRRAPPWTKERIIESILTRALNNEPLGSRTVRPRSLADAGGRMFGTWASALVAAGLDPQRYGSSACRSCGNTPVGQKEPPHGPTRTGDEKKAVESPRPAGDARPGNGGTPAHCWSHSGVLQAILLRLRQHHAMNAKAVYYDDRPLYRAATRRFGNWSNALRAAGLNPDEYRKCPRRSSAHEDDPANGCHPRDLNEFQA